MTNTKRLVLVLFENGDADYVKGMLSECDNNVKSFHGLVVLKKLLD